jgi:hypothetical protein
VTGRPALLTPDQARSALALAEAGSSITAIAAALEVSRSTVRRSMARVLPEEPDAVEQPAAAAAVWPPPATSDTEWHLVPVHERGRMVPAPARWVRLFSNLPTLVEVDESGDVYCKGCGEFLPVAEVIALGNGHLPFPRPVGAGQFLPAGDDDGPDAA